MNYASLSLLLILLLSVLQNSNNKYVKYYEKDTYLFDVISNCEYREQIGRIDNFVANCFQQYQNNFSVNLDVNGESVVPLIEWNFGNIKNANKKFLFIYIPGGTDQSIIYSSVTWRKYLESNAKGNYVKFVSIGYSGTNVNTNLRVGEIESALKDVTNVSKRLTKEKYNRVIIISESLGSFITPQFKRSDINVSYIYVSPILIDSDEALRRLETIDNGISRYQQLVSRVNSLRNGRRKVETEFVSTLAHLKRFFGNKRKPRLYLRDDICSYVLIGENDYLAPKIITGNKKYIIIKKAGHNLDNIDNDYATEVGRLWSCFLEAR